MVNRVLRDFSFRNHSKHRTSANVCFKYDQNYKTTQSISDLPRQMETVNADVCVCVRACVARETES